MKKRWDNKPNSCLKVRMRESQRRILRLFNYCSERDVEYSFAYRNITGSGLRILDIGGCDSLLPFHLAKEGHHVTVYDFRPYPERHPNLTVIQADLLKNKSFTASFNVVMMISTIEHIGFGSYGASSLPDADFIVMNMMQRVVTDPGRLILTLPFNGQERIISGFERWYDEKRLKKLLNGWFIVNAEYWAPEKKLLGRWVKFRPSTKYEAMKAYEEKGQKAIACFSLSPRPINRI